MDTLETMYFPDTVISTDGQSPLFLFFDTVHILQPVERDAAHRQATDLGDTFMERGFCQVHTPAPLGTDRQRFLHLVKDIKERKDDYAAQLGSLTIASFSTPENSKLESRQSIISSLFGAPPEEEDKKEEERKARLWQARLVLAIAEILDHEDEEIVDALSFLDKSEEALFDRLLGRDEESDEDNPFTDLSRLQTSMAPSRAGLTKNRLKAWLCLLEEGRQLPSFWIWTTSRPEMADIIFEKYEAKSGRKPTPILQLELPAATGVELQDHMNKIEAFREQAKPLLFEISENLSTLVHQENIPQDPVQFENDARVEQWKTLLETHFPVELYSRIPFCFHLLSNVSFNQLANRRIQDSLTKDGIYHEIVAVLG